MCVNRADSASCELIRLKDEGHRVGVLRRERGLDEPRAHSEDLDAVLHHFDAEAFAVVDNGSLAGAVGFRPRKAADAGNRTNADQRSGVSLDHRRKEAVEGVRHADNVDPIDPVHDGQIRVVLRLHAD